MSLPNQVFVNLLCGADIRINGVFVLTKLSPKTKVLEQAKQKLPSLSSLNHMIVLRVLFLQHLEKHRKTWSDSMSETQKDKAERWKKKEIHLSDFIIVRVDVMQAFNYMSRRPQDATRVDWVKQLHGHLSARHHLHINRHYWLLYKTHIVIKNIPQTDI